MTGYIYLRHRDGELSYVGSTCRPNHRYRAPFCFQILEEVARPTHHKLILRERFWMSYLIEIHGLRLSNKMQPVSFGGFLTHGKEAREKISAAIKNAMLNPELRERLRAANKGKAFTPERRRKHREVMNRPRCRAKLKRVMGTPKFKARRSALVKQLWCDPEFRAKITSAIKRAHRTSKSRARHSAAVKRLWRDPKYRIKHRRWSQPGSHERQSEAIRKSWKLRRLTRAR